MYMDLLLVSSYCKCSICSGGWCFSEAW